LSVISRALPASREAAGPLKSLRLLVTAVDKTPVGLTLGFEHQVSQMRDPRDVLVVVGHASSSSPRSISFARSIVSVQ
jgi:hypothetical protein